MRVFKASRVPDVRWHEIQARESSHDPGDPMTAARAWEIAIDARPRPVRASGARKGAAGRCACALAITAGR